MPFWIIDIIFVAVVVAVLGLVLWAARRSRRRGGLPMVAAAMLAFGMVFDPPKRHMSEAAEPKRGGPDSGEPPLDD